MCDLKTGEVSPVRYLVSVLLEEGIIRVFSSAFYFSKFPHHPVGKLSLFNIRLKYRIWM